MEEWKDVVGYESYFQISDSGRLYSKRTGKILSQSISSTGYYQHCTKIGGRRGITVLLKIHRLVCEAFHPNPENLPVVNHKDGNKLNNDKDNVEWSTYSCNTQHAYDIGIMKAVSGEQSGRSKLTVEQIKSIREEYSTGLYTNRELGNKYGVAHSTIGRIIRGETWNKY